METVSLQVRLFVELVYTGLYTQDGHSFVNYTVHVCRTTSSGSRNWIVMRRYSDFHDLHMQLREKVINLWNFVVISGGFIML